MGRIYRPFFHYEERFSKKVIIENLGKTDNASTSYMTICDCGNISIVTSITALTNNIGNECKSCKMKRIWKEKAGVKNELPSV